jgi:FAD/FMN-containing dehydrogenase
MKNLLICISAHYNPDRVKYLDHVIHMIIRNYTGTFDIIIDTQSFDYEHYNNRENIQVFVHQNLKHPFHLTWCHRKHIKDSIDHYENFMYIEDDMYVPFENYLNYLENFKILYPKYVPSFVRIEEANGDKFISDIPEKQRLDSINVGGKWFHRLPFLMNYHAFWIMPQKELKESMKPNFEQYTDGREFAAMYVGWELGKPTLIELEKGLISKKCYSYHLPSNYALSKESKNGKIKPEDIFI